MSVEPRVTPAIGGEFATLSGSRKHPQVVKIYDRLFAERSVLHDYIQ